MLAGEGTAPEKLVFRFNDYVGARIEFRKKPKSDERRCEGGYDGTWSVGEGNPVEEPNNRGGDETLMAREQRSRCQQVRRLKGPQGNPKDDSDDESMGAPPR